MKDGTSNELSEKELDEVAGGLDSQLFNTSSFKSPFYKGGELASGKGEEDDSTSLTSMEEKEPQV